ncbi:MAG: Ig-like domain-containing protein, partial [Bacteroidales bacterium]|nr:Ig-like domain-containing protein [Bacteroidales bacterium]
ALKWLKAYVNDTLTLADSIVIQCDDPNDTLYVDETAQMSAVMWPANTTIKNVTWSVLQTSLATINQSGLLVPVATGKVTVKASAWDGSGKLDTRYIWIINRPVDSIALKAPGDIDTIGVNETLQLQAEVFPSNATNKSINWSVTPGTLAEISAEGLLTAVDAGKVTVTATASDGSGTIGSTDIVIKILVGIKDPLLHYGVNIFPNPVTNGKCRLTGIKGFSHAEILDLQGRVIKNIGLTGQDALDVELDIRSGMYLIRFSTGHQAFISKLVVE